MIRFRWAVLAAWVVATLVSLPPMAALTDLLTNRFTLPGTETARAERILERQFHQTTEGGFTVVVKGPPGRESALLEQVRRAAERGAEAVPTGRVAAVQTVGEGVVTALVVSELPRADAKAYTDDLRRALDELPDAETWVTGQAAIEADLDPVFAEDLKVGELYVAIPIALAIVVFVFGTLAFLLPFMVAAVSIPVTLAIIWAFAHFMELSTYLQNLVMLIGLGIAIDYSLLVVYRYREELKKNGSREDAVVRTMQTAGRAVVFSGTAVAIGLALMLFMPLPFMRGFGLGGLIIPLVSVLCAVTLLPVLLYFLGHRLDRVRLVPSRIIERREDEERAFWVRLSGWVMRRPVPIAAATVALLLLCAAPVLELELGPGSNEGIPQRLESVQGLNVLEQTIGAGAVAPTEIVVDTKRAGAARDPGVQAAVGRLLAELGKDPEVGDVRYGEGPQFVDEDERYLRIQVLGARDYGDPESQEFVRRLREQIIPAAGFPNGVEAIAGGGPPGGVDFLDTAYGAFPWLVAAVLLLTYFLLLRAFRSVLLPLKAIVLNLLSIGAAYGVLVVVFKWGLGEYVGLTSFDQIEGWIPIFLFAMLFGLSMDYEVFLVSRMREEWDRTRDNERAVALGLAKTGRLVTAAGLVMFAAFMGFVAGSVVGLQQFGLGLAAAILVDVTIVRALLVPSAMKIFGRYNWWLPERVARVVRVEPSPLERPAPAGAS